MSFTFLLQVFMVKETGASGQDVLGSFITGYQEFDSSTFAVTDYCRRGEIVYVKVWDYANFRCTFAHDMSSFSGALIN